jgi:hypothetical protein
VASGLEELKPSRIVLDSISSIEHASSEKGLPSIKMRGSGHETHPYRLAIEPVGPARLETDGGGSPAYRVVPRRPQGLTPSVTSDTAV